MIAPAQAELARRVEDLLGRERLLGATHEVRSYSTPRRLAVLVKGVNAAQADMEEQLTGPSWSVAFKNGEATPAAHAFAKKAGVELSALKKVTTPKGEYVAATAHRKGRLAAEILEEQLPKEIASVYWPKNMYWRAGKPERFVRPVKWLLALLDHAIVPVEFAGVHAANVTYGHRILHGDDPVTVEHAADYLGVLEAAHVTADVELRRHRIRKGLDEATRTVPGARWREDEALVDTVTHLTEWPSVLLGSFQAEYLKLPEEVLVTVMRDHQKYFAVEDAQGKLAPYFLTVLNTQPVERADEVIRHGNERVLRARFNDARFFWEFDQRVPLTDRVEMLYSVTFHRKLGTYHEKIARMKALVDDLIHLPKAPQPAPVISGIDEGSLMRACELCKTDLTCELVKEFTELQGVVGGLYAMSQGENETLGWAIYDQYKPQSTDDEIPRNVEGCLLALSDKLDTLATMFAIGEKPSGSRDPFALRRQANGIIKIIAENRLLDRLELSFLSARAVGHLDDQIRYWEGEDHKTIPINKGSTINELTAFFRERVEFYLRDVRGFAYDVVNAVLAAGADNIPDVIARAEALSAVRGSDDFAAIAAAFKRMKNILRQANIESLKPVDRDKFTEPVEQSLHDQMIFLMMKILPIQPSNYGEALEQIATLRPQVDLFFDKVMVMADDPAVRQNRLALIATVLGSFSSIADFSEIVT
jgi:glycyl-tRNA synthetase beta chain